MTAAADDALREMAANRGCRLVRSRVRTPGRGDYGRFGLKDARTGRKIFGFGEKGLTATAEEIGAFLRGNAAATWKSSVGSAERVPKARPKPAPKPRPVPKLVIREARPADSEPIAALITGLEFEITAADVRGRLTMLRKSGATALVAVKDRVIGIVTTSMMIVLHRPRPVGRISLLAVAEDARGEGIGTALVAEAERRLAAEGCGLVEVTSHRRLVRAHGFYEKIGYERTSYRFAKSLVP